LVRRRSRQLRELNAALEARVTERTAALRASNERLEKVLAVEAVGVMFWDLTTGCLVDANETFLKMMGYNRGDLEARDLTWQKFTPPEYHEVSLAEIEKFQRTGRVGPYEKEYFNKDGTRRWLLFSGSSLGGNMCVEFCVDIADRKKAEAELQESQRQNKTFADLLRLSKQPFGSGYPDGRLGVVNPAFEELVGYTQEELRTVKWDEITPREWLEREKELLAELERTGTPIRYEKEYIRKDGGRVPVELFCGLVRDAEGRPEHYYSFVTDLTQRKLAEAALRASERHYRRLVETAQEGIWLIDAQGHTTFANAKMCELLGYSADEMLGRHLFEFMDEEAKSQAQVYLGHRELGISEQRECRFRRKDGSDLWTMVSTNPLFDANGKYTDSLAMVTDITEQRRAREALRASEERFRVAQEMSPDGFTILRPVRDESGRVVDFTWVYENATAERFTGKGLEELKGQRLLEVFPGHRGGEIWEAYRHVAETGERRVLEARYSGETVALTWFRLAVVPLVGGDVAVLAQDITRQKDFEAELQRLVEERTAKLQELVGELEHFSYTITHDLKSPLRAMRGFAEIAGTLCERIEAKECLGRIATSAERMDRLIADALSYSRSVRQELPLEDVDAGALLRGMLDSYPEFQTARARIVVEGRLPMVLANEAGLTQCFSNLLGNAVKFVKPGEKSDIRIWAEEVESEKGRTPGGWVRIWVEDKGIGITKEMMPRVFDMFARASKDYEGTGIGLALVRKVVQRMGGKVGVESERGKGSRFWIELSKGGERPNPIAAAGLAAGDAGQGNVLYVEDEENDALFMQRAFGSNGMAGRLRVVGDGRAAIDYLSGSGQYSDRTKYPLPALVLLDLNLPQIPGFQVLEWIKNNPDYARLPVVVFSSSTREDDRVRARELGAEAFVAKPSSGMEFGRVVEGLKGKLKTVEW